MSEQSGSLYVIATPIGNLADLSPRATQVLKQANVIAAEDTRHSGTLLAHADVRTAMLPLHEHNEDQVTPALVERIRNGEVVALISDAGTPLVSDPGFVLVRAARAAGITVRTVPGACAAVAALSVSGLASDRFVFEGFLPAKATARRRRLAALVNETRTLVFYESSHRIAHAARDLATLFDNERRVCLARELTKLHEQSVPLAIGELPEWLAADATRCRGEFVLVVAGAPRGARAGEYTVELEGLMRELLTGMSVREAARAAVRLLGVGRNEAYRLGLALAQEQ